MAVVASQQEQCMFSSTSFTTATSWPNTLSPGTSKWAKRYRTSAAEIRCRALPAAKKIHGLHREKSWKILEEIALSRVVLLCLSASLSSTGAGLCVSSRICNIFNFVRWPMDECIQKWMDWSKHPRYNIFVNRSNQCSEWWHTWKAPPNTWANCQTTKPIVSRCTTNILLAACAQLKNLSWNHS